MNEIFERYRIESRGEGRYSYKTWLVLYDKEKEDFVKEKNRKSYKRFQDSDEIVQWYMEEN